MILPNSMDITPQLEGWPRIIICGGPRTGKSTLAVRAGERYGLPVKFGDSLVGTHDWSDASLEVSTWMDDPSSWIIDGVVAVRAIRKWLNRNHMMSLGALVVFLRDPIQVQTDKQRSMSKAIETIWREIEPELIARGTKIIHRDT